MSCREGRHADLSNRALINDLLPFSRANPASSNYDGRIEFDPTLTEKTGGTIGFQPVKGEVVKSVVFSQWTKLLDRCVCLLSSFPSFSPLQS